MNQFLDYQNGWGTGENSYLLDHKLTLQPNGNRLQTDLPNFSGYNSSAGAKLRSWGAPLWDQVIYGHDGVTYYSFFTSGQCEGFLRNRPSVHAYISCGRWFEKE